MSQPYQIVIIEDDFDDQYLLQHAFQTVEYDVRLKLFSSGKEYYEQASAEVLPVTPPDLILLDLNLPVWDGRKTLKALRSLKALQITPIVIYTTSRSEIDMRETYALGANSYVVKAISYEKIETNIKLICDYWLNLSSIRAKAR